MQSFHDDELAPLARVHGRTGAIDAVRAAVDSGIRTNLDLISSHYAVVTAGADHREAVEAFIAKRKPVFE